MNLRPLKAEDLQLLFQWCNLPRVREHAFSPAPIPYESHERWFWGHLNDEKSFSFVYEDQNRPLGFVRFNPITIPGWLEWSFYIGEALSPPGSGTNMARMALSAAEKHAGGYHMVLGQVLAENQISRLFHEKLGFVQTEERQVFNETRKKEISVISYSYDLLRASKDTPSPLLKP